MPFSVEVTFTDDPLHLLRNIHFVSFLEGTVHDEIFAAVQNMVIGVSHSHHVLAYVINFMFVASP